MKKLLLTALLCASALLAEDTGFVTHTELGYVQTSGNTNTQTGAVDAMGKQTWGNNTVQLDFDYLYGEENDIENNNKFETELNYDYALTDDFSFNYLVGYKEDRFSGFDYQLYTGPGVKLHTLKGPTHILDFQTNILYAKDLDSDKFYSDVNKTIETPYPFTPDKGAFKTDGSVNEYAAFYIKGDYEWNITESFKFKQMLSYRVDLKDEDVYFIASKTSLISKISDIFSMGLNYKVDYVNTQPVGNVKTDKVFTASVIIDY